jgi:uncharacterized membrane-anchored protein YhcB (DUF1043 family)
MQDQLFYIFSAALLGIAIGALIMYFATDKNKDSEKNIAKMEEELQNYQQDVVNHFEQTADLVDDLTKSYKKVFDHLGKSARELMTEEQVQYQIEKRKGNQITLAFLAEESGPDNQEQRQTKDDMLSEESNSDNVIEDDVNEASESVENANQEPTESTDQQDTAKTIKK